MNLLASEEIESKGSLDLGLQTRNQSSGDLHTLSNEVVAGDDVEIVELVTTEVVKATTTSTGKRVEIIETHLESLEKQSSSPHALHKEISALCNENKDIEKKRNTHRAMIEEERRAILMTEQELCGRGNASMKA